MRRGKKHVLTLCIVSMFAAMVCACTFISVPLPIGYFNLGDIVILVAAYIIGFPAAIAAAVGAALADVLMGYTIYAPATAIIKGLCVVIACAILLITKKLVSNRGLFIARYVIAALAAETFMVLGYLFFEAVILSYGTAALASIPGNCIQGLCGIVGSVTIYGALYLSGAERFIRKWLN